MLASQELEDELVSLDAIYPGCIRTEDGDHLRYLLFPPNYPGLCVGLEFGQLYPEVSEPPHVYTARGPGADQDLLQDILNSVFIPDQVCVFDFIEALNDLQVVDEDDDEREGVASCSNIDGEDEYSYHDDDDAVHGNGGDKIDPLEGWICSEPIVDRKSVFIGRAIPVTAPEQVDLKVAQLKGDKKIAKAAHNMVAYRIVSSSGNIIQDCDDDGETAAGSRMLHLLTLMDCKDILIVVTRWYGGTKLGSDRFRHINNAARLALVKGNYIPEKQESSGKRGKKGKKK